MPELRSFENISGCEAATLLRSEPDAVLFDVFRPQQGKGVQVGSAGLELGEKSLAVRLTLGGHAPLTEADIDAAVQAVLAQLKAQVGARLRG